MQIKPTKQKVRTTMLPFSRKFLDKNKNGRGSQLTFNPLPDDKILDWSKLKQIADDILKYI